MYNYQPASRRSLAQLASNKNVTRKASMDTFTSWLPSRRKRFVTNIIVKYHLLTSVPIFHQNSITDQTRCKVDGKLTITKSLLW